MKTPPFLTGAELKAACTEAGAFWEIYLSFFSGFFSLKNCKADAKKKKTHFFILPVKKKKKKKKKNRYVCPEGAPRPRHAGGLRDGRPEGDAQGRGQEHVPAEAVEVEKERRGKRGKGKQGEEREKESKRGESNLLLFLRVFFSGVLLVDFHVICHLSFVTSLECPARLEKPFKKICGRG